MNSTATSCAGGESLVDSSSRDHGHHGADDAQRQRLHVAHGRRAELEGQHDQRDGDGPGEQVRRHQVEVGLGAQPDRARSSLARSAPARPAPRQRDQRVQAAHHRHRAAPRRSSPAPGLQRQPQRRRADLAEEDRHHRRRRNSISGSRHPGGPRALAATSTGGQHSRAPASGRPAPGACAAAPSATRRSPRPPPPGHQGQRGGHRQGGLL
jgi:hypothetical protein